MKELSIEEKAKRYDEAIKRAKELLEIGVKDTRDKRVVLSFFPELKESEDEKMKKSIIYALRNGGFYDNDKTEEAIAWLEKQDCKDIHLLELKAKAYDDAKERMSYAYNQNRVPIGFMNEIFPNIKLYEKQGEQKSANKVEPKFHKGDWVVFENRHQSIYQVEKIEDGYYILRHTHGGTFRICVLHDDSLRLWTIQDAKDGDVLANAKSVFIYAKVLYNKPYAHCGVDKFGVFKDNCLKYDWSNSVDNIHPATKEQRDLLFQKMKEAGYE